MIVIIIIVIFCPNIIAFCSVKLYFFLKVIRNPASKSLRSIEISLHNNLVAKNIQGKYFFQNL
jgi:hypothetical protein